MVNNTPLAYANTPKIVCTFKLDDPRRTRVHGQSVKFF